MRLSRKKIIEFLRNKRVTDRRWSTNRKIVNEIESLELLEVNWPSLYDFQDSKLFIKDENQWSTYKECFWAEVWYDKRLLCKATVFNGRLSDGLSTTLRFTATFALPDEWASYFKEPVLYAAERRAEIEYEKYLEEQRKVWMRSFMNNLFS